ncbi:MAG: hypothetical protein WAM81_06230 [Acidimicrobiia bacterium]
MQLELSGVERELLVEILQGRFGQLREEIYSATVSTYKDQLKAVEVRINDLLVRLGAEA